MSKINADLIYETGDDITVKHVLDNINTRQSVITATELTTYTVGSGGDYETLNEIIDELSKVNILSGFTTNTGETVRIEILPNYIMTEQLVIDHDLSHVFITGSPLTIDLDSVVGEHSIKWYTVIPGILISNGRSPVFDVDIIADTTVPNSALHACIVCRHGVLSLTAISITTNTNYPLISLFGSLISTGKVTITSSSNNWGEIPCYNTSLYLGELELICTASGTAMGFYLEASNCVISGHFRLDSTALDVVAGTIDVSLYIFIKGTYSWGIGLYRSNLFARSINIETDAIAFDGIYIVDKSSMLLSTGFTIASGALTDGIGTFLNIDKHSSFFGRQCTTSNNPNVTDLFSVSNDSKATISVGYNLTGTLSIDGGSSINILYLASNYANNLPATLTSGSTLTITGNSTLTNIALSLSGGSIVNLTNTTMYALPQTPNTITPNGIIYQN